MRDRPTLTGPAAVLALLVAAGLMTAAPVFATLSHVGSYVQIGTGGLGEMHPDVAYDTKHDVYLVVWGDGGGSTRRPAWAQLVTPGGALVGSKIELTSCSGELYGQKPKVAYSVGTSDDVFLVTYREWCGGVVRQWAHLVRYSANGAVSVARVAIRTAGNPGGVVYNAQRKEFLAVWEENVKNVGYDPFYRVVTLARDANGAVTGFGTLPAAAAIATLPETQGVPDVALAPGSQSYFFTFQGDDPNSTSFALMARTMDAATGAMSPLLYVAKGGYPVDAAPVYLPEVDQFAVFWRQNYDIVGRRFAPVSGAAVTGAYPVLARPNSTDGATGAAYDAASSEVMVAGMNDDYYIWASEVTSSGGLAATFRASTAPPNTSGGGSFFPQIAGYGGGFGLIYALNYKSVYLDRYSASGASDGGGGGDPAPAPSPVSQPVAVVESPGGGFVAQPVTVKGYALDRGATSGTGVSAVHVYAYPNPGSGQPPIFVGIASYGLADSAAAAAYGSQFANAGFSVVLDGLESGTYQLVGFALSTVANAFNNAATVTVGVKGPSMALENPTANLRSKAPIWVTGWAIDQAATSGTGVDLVHVYAYPNPGSGTPPLFVGSAGYGIPRYDVPALANGQFLKSGFALSITSLPAGFYRIVAYAHSTVRNAWTNARWADVTVDPGPMMAVDSPTNNSTLTSGFSLTGWAFDPSAASGSGVDAVVAWAFPFSGSATAPVYLGSATLGIARADVYSVFGYGSTSGYAMTTAALPAGQYVVYVSAHSSVTNRYSNVASRVIKIQ